MHRALKLLNLTMRQYMRQRCSLVKTPLVLPVFLLTVTACIAGDRVIELSGEIVDETGQAVMGCDVIFRSPSRDWFEVPYPVKGSRFNIYLVFNEFPTGPILEVVCPGYDVRVIPALEMRRDAYDYGKIVVQRL